MTVEIAQIIYGVLALNIFAASFFDQFYHASWPLRGVAFAFAVYAAMPFVWEVQ